MEISLTSIYVANAIGIVLIVITLMGNTWRLHSNTIENKCLLLSLYLILSACIVDPLVFTFDNKPGMLSWAIIFLGNTWLFCSNMLVAFLWLYFLGQHLNGAITQKHLRSIFLALTVGVIIIAANFFTPIIFDVDANNVYSRKPGYWFFILITYTFMIDSIVLYVKSRSRGGILKFFPIWIYFFPILLGTAAQTIFYGISTISVGLAAAMTGVFASLQSEAIFRDRLTTLYNRAYLDHLMGKFFKKSNSHVTGMMLDLNSFKKINDDFGHSIGDDALIQFSNILRSTVGDLGSVIRYAGDEFIILLNTQEQESIEQCVKSIHDNLNRFNAQEGKPYKLSTSIGYDKLDLQNHNVDDFIKSVDKKMYENKKEFYTKNRSADRREHRL